MQGKFIWFTFCSIIAVSIVLASCGKAPTGAPQTAVTGTAIQPSATSNTTANNSSTPSTTQTTTPQTVATTVETTTTQSDKPKYGGTFIGVFDTATSGFDDAYSRPSTAYTTVITNEGLVGGDWSLGPAGSGKTTWAWQTDPSDLVTGFLAESWDVPDPNTIIYHIRKGVHFALDSNSEASRLVNGREMTADDVAFSYTRVLQTVKTANLYGTLGVWFKSATATDKYTVTIKCDDESGVRTAVAMQSSRGMLRIWPKELIEKYGNASNWKNVVGTGAYMLTDYVAGSSFTMKRNPNYWQKNPAGPGKGDQLPYLDGITWLDLYDTSTRMAALRTGKIDIMINVGWEDGANIIKTKPDIKYQKLVSGSNFGVAFVTDKSGTPLNDLKVREALLMAVDRWTLAKTYYGGAPDINPYPVANVPEFQSVYTPPDQMPDAAKMTFQYNVDAAKALLAQTKWPTGFKTSVITASYPAWVDQLSLLKNYWSKIGVDLQINSMEYGTYLPIYSALGAPEMIAYVTPGVGIPYKMYWTVIGDNGNSAKINDPYLINHRLDLWKYENINNQTKKDQLLREASTYWLGLAPGMFMPLPYTYFMWQPWINNYHGEYCIGFGYFNLYVNYIWEDQSLKTQMTGK